MVSVLWTNTALHGMMVGYLVRKNHIPNPTRTEGHWILYNLGHTYALGGSYWWNNNEKAYKMA